MVGPRVGRPLRRQRHVCERVLGVGFRRGDIGWMRTDEIEENHPRLGIVAVFGEPAQGVFGTAGVVLQISRIARARPPKLAVFVAKGRLIADAAEDIADAINYVQRLDFLAKSVVCILPLEVQLADRVATEALFTQALMPGGGRAIVGMPVVPVADLMHVAAGGQ